MTTVEFTPDEMKALAGLITWGAKHPNTGSEAIVQAADLLRKLQAAIDANGAFVVKDEPK